MILSAQEVQAKASKDGIQKMLERCNPGQLALINRIHDNAPWKGLANCPDNKLAETYELLRRSY